MAKKGKGQQKRRVEFRKNRTQKVRQADITKQFNRDEFDADKAVSRERISGKGELTRKRTIVGHEEATDDDPDNFTVHVDKDACLQGRVLRVQGLVSEVEAPDKSVYQCATRRLLKTMSTDVRHVVAAGDHVWFRPSGEREGIIESVGPRYGVLSRTSRGRQHVIVANVDQLIIVSSAGEPGLKPNLIDRYLVTAESAGIRPIICINKVDLVDPVQLQTIVGVYGGMGYDVHLVSAIEETGIDRLRQSLIGKDTVLSGQSGVGKSSLLNAIEPGLNLRVNAVSRENDKGKHTTTTATLIPLATEGHVIDTPGIRQFQLWDIIPEEVAGLFRDIRPLVNHCRFPNCTHTHEADCAVKDAVADGILDTRRYESYCQIHAGDAA
ncbi:ribosome small subunit-dependent GTPase A [Blastopirellula marina]|uniref:Small ribosomal subunit biogenesis GTPase RsgA n=1 Tax=Blastopirellula marina TaxID=124 RepID=A0A2S8GD64_9BACT|nr:ribosome small subunit-dependent GTPase A [Blastopirellula marina]PQO42250.1 ribosome small subunit-dependent GTPase A [Blastopirellula marina]